MPEARAHHTEASGASPHEARNVLYDGRDATDLARLLDLPRVVVFDSVPSTLDVAHSLGAEGAASGTLVLAEQQTAGRGRSGRRWASARGAGIWLTLLEHPRDSRALDVLSLRIGLRTAPVLERWTTDHVVLKWPNDLYVGDGKLGGVLVEARWRESRPEWVAIGVGINVRTPADTPQAAHLAGGVRRSDVLAELVPALRAAAASTGPLTADELRAFAARDLSAGRRCVAPVEGRVVGIDTEGALLVLSEDRVIECRAGSLVFAEES
jgi:BirA family biotin operon repressor/biotin-[acetyl-CoA-carboxylase] ligase